MPDPGDHLAGADDAESMQVRQLLRSLPPPQIPTDVADRLYRRLQVELLPRQRVARARVLATAAAVLLLLAAATVASGYRGSKSMVRAEADPAPVASGFSYSADTIAILVPQLLAEIDSIPLADLWQREGTFTHSSAGVDSCMTGIGTKSEAQPVIDLANYDDNPAAILVIPDQATNGEVSQVYVVGLKCSYDDPELKAFVPDVPTALAVGFPE